MIYSYLRFSTDKQDERQQKHTVEEYCISRGIKVDRYEMDEGVSGKISFTERKLFGILESMKPGDTLIVSELSRLGRNMCDLHRLISEELKRRKIRLIVIKSGIDLDCANLKAIDEMVLQAFAFSAQLEREMIAERTKSALEARQKAGMQIGGTNELWGSKTGNNDRKKAIQKAVTVSKEIRRKKALQSPANLAFRDFMAFWQSVNGVVAWNTDWQLVAEELNQRGLKTSTGLPFNSVRARSMYTKLKNMA